MRFCDIPFRVKFALVTSAICLFCVLLCTGSFIYQERNTLEREYEIHNRSIANMLAFNSSAVVTFREEDAGQELLQGLRNQPQVECAALYASDGEMIASYQTSDINLPLRWDSPASSATMRTKSGSLIVLEPISESGEDIGVVYLRSSQDGLEEKLVTQISTATAVGGAALLATLILSALLQQLISAPILKLASTARKITDDGDYSVRVNRPGKDELGTLYSAFNKMLNQIDSSEQRLKSYNDDLESSVQQRTSELQKEIREHERTEQNLLKAKETAEAANKVKSEFLANMSHEIRTPLNAIIGFTELMLNDDLPKQHEEYMGLISSSGKHLLSVINDVLDISKIEAGRMSIHVQPTSPQELVAGVISIMSVKAQEKGIQLNYRWDSPIPERICTDPDRLKQILINLVGNAIKFTSKGSVSVCLKVIKGKTQSMLEVQVVDTGVGIPESQQKRIFEPFTQADYSATRTFGGTGLGLAITRRLLDAMDGSLELRSKQGAGSCFTFRVPTGDLADVRFTAAVKETHGTTAAETIPMDEPKSFSDKHRILIVEDGKVNRRLVTLILQRAGYEVDSAENGKIGYDKATSDRFDAILMDMQMPVMDGYTATRELRKEGYTLPIIALTAHAMPGDREKCINAGCSDYLTKPADAKILDETLQQWIKASQTEVVEV